MRRYGDMPCAARDERIDHTVKPFVRIRFTVIQPRPLTLDDADSQTPSRGKFRIAHAAAPARRQGAPQVRIDRMGGADQFKGLIDRLRSDGVEMDGRGGFPRAL